MTTINYEQSAVGPSFELMNKLNRCVIALKAWEQWEADWIMSNECWDTPSGLPRLNQELMDRMTAIQELRNEALK